MIPRRAYKSHVRYFKFDWRHVDILVGLDANTLDADRVQVDILTDPERLLSPTSTRTGTTTTATHTPGLAFDPPPAKTSTLATLITPDLEAVRSTTAADELGPLTGGVRLFFYGGEESAARHAAASIENSYRYLVQQFHYIPERTFPYILYNSYQEFLQTNLFPAQEGLLGVTSTRGDLRLTLPYFGDFQFFRDVSVHEMTHQFTIQKVRTMAERANLRSDPLERFPLWFVEGIAEFYAKSGLDNETEMLVRDILLNPDVEEGYAMLDFWADRPGSGLWTYKVGQIRVVFLAETYGTWLVQSILEKSPLMVSDIGDEARVPNFAELIAHLTKDEPRIIAIKFEAWLKQRAFRGYLGAKQSFADLKPLEGTEEYIDSLNASPSGNLLMYRSYDLVTGNSKLTIVDPRAPGDDRTVVTDGRPGYESLHPVTRRSFDLTDDALVFIAESGGGDVIYWEKIQHEAAKQVQEPPKMPGDPMRPRDPMRRPLGAPPLNDPEVDEPKARWEASISLHDRRAFHLKDKGLFAASSPAISPDGKRVAFVGLGMDGNKDLFLLTPKDGDDFELKQLTFDVYAERDVAWGPSGIVFSSDATSTKHHNLFWVDPDQPGAPRRLTSAQQDQFDPEVTSDGRIFFSAYENGAANVFEALPQGMVRRTDVVTGLFALSPGPEGGLWALFHHAGRRRIVEVPKKTLTLASVATWKPDVGAAWHVPESQLDVSVPYNWTSPKNWELGGIFGLLGAGSAGVFGQVFASANDRLHNHALFLQLFVLGSFELSQGELVYLNQEHRLEWGFGPFQSLRYRYDSTLQNVTLPRQLISFERFFGAEGLIRYPFNKFFYLQGELQVGGNAFALASSERDLLSDRTQVPEAETRDLVGEWEKINGGTRFETQGTLTLGYDTIAYNRGTGPIAGQSVLLEGQLALLPFEKELFGSVRVDAEQYFPLFGRTNLFLRVGSASIWGGKYARQFYLSSFDTLRGVPFGNNDYLLGRTYFYSTAELQIPLNMIIRLLLFTDIEGVVALDFGGVADDFKHLFDRRVMDFVLGFNFGLGPLVFRLHFAKPIYLGVPYPNEDGSWVTNFSLGWLYF
ncbi:MAG: BamA/TamA family outer membrane protein [Myxococcota bacterium]